MHQQSQVTSARRGIIFKATNKTCILLPLVLFLEDLGGSAFNFFITAEVSLLKSHFLSDEASL